MTTMRKSCGTWRTRALVAVLMATAFVMALPARAAPRVAPGKTRQAPPAAPGKKAHAVPRPKPCKPTLTKSLPARASTKGKPAGPNASVSTRPPGSAAVPAPRPNPANEVVKPGIGDPNRDRVLDLQQALDGIVHGKVLGRLRVGMRVEELASGRVLYGWRSGSLMDPASNQKVLAAVTALLRLGNDFRYRTEVTGAPPDPDGNIRGPITLRGSGDPSLRARHLDELAQKLVAQGVSVVEGDVQGDPRRIGTDELGSGRPPLRVGASAIEVHVRPGEKAGARPLVSVFPSSDVFTIVNQAETRAKGRANVGVSIERSGAHLKVVVSGRVSIARGEVVLRRAPPSPPLFAALLFRQALIKAGIDVRGGVGIADGDSKPRLSAKPTVAGTLLALGNNAGDTMPAFATPEPAVADELLAVHHSEPLTQLLRRVNKDSDNEWAERVLETVGAEVAGGAATTTKGLRVLRETLGELGLPAGAYSPANGSGLGHQNRVTAAGMALLLRRVYTDPRIGPELMQSLSVGGVDGTTRNRFRGTSAARRVRAKTGTLNGVSCLSGFVGDGSDVLVFSILVEGHRRRAVPGVRAAQVSAVNAMMRFARETLDAVPSDSGAPGTDYESGEELDAADVSSPPGSSELEHAAATSR